MDFVVADGQLLVDIYGKQTALAKLVSQRRVGIKFDEVGVAWRGSTVWHLPASKRRNGSGAWHVLWNVLWNGRSSAVIDPRLCCEHGIHGAHGVHTYTVYIPGVHTWCTYSLYKK